jgi:hypothetical protein
MRNNPPALPADGEENADFLSALEDRHHHRVHHAEHFYHTVWMEGLQLMARAMQNPWLVPTTSLATTVRPAVKSLSSVGKAGPPPPWWCSG